MIWVVDSDPVMAGCVMQAICRTDDGTGGGAFAYAVQQASGGEVVAGPVSHDVRVYHDVIDAINGLADGVPELIFLEVMLAGPDGFTLLNELMSYDDTMRVPVVLVTGVETLATRGVNLVNYGVVGVLDKATMRPEQIRAYVEEFTGVEDERSADDFSAKMGVIS